MLDATRRTLDPVRRTADPIRRTLDAARRTLVLIGLAAAAALASATAAQAQIPPGYEVIRLTDDPDFDDRPAINNYGQVVWSKRIDQDGDQEEIFFWDGVEVRRITDNNVRDAFPDINDHGTIVWSRAKRPGDLENFEIAMRRKGEVTILTDNEVGDWAPTVNNLDHIAWSRISGRGCTGLHLMYYDGSDVRQVTDDDLGNQSPEINNSDEIAWVAYDDCANPWLGTIKLFSGGRFFHLTAGDSQDQSPTINDFSQVAWRNGYPNPPGLMLWVNGITRRITDSGRVPDINNQGDISFVRVNEDGVTLEQWLWSGGEVRRLSDPSVSTGRGAINDCGEVAWWFGDFPDVDMVLMRMIPGDASRNGFVDSGDFIELANSLTGPGIPENRCSDPTADVDRDSDVDLYDFALRQAETGDFDNMQELIECMSGPIGLDEFCLRRALDMDYDRDVDLRDFALFQQEFRVSP